MVAQNNNIPGDASHLVGSPSVPVLPHPAKFGDQLESPMGIVCEPTNTILENKVVSGTRGIIPIPNIFVLSKMARNTWYQRILHYLWKHPQ